MEHELAVDETREHIFLHAYYLFQILENIILDSRKSTATTENCYVSFSRSNRRERYLSTKATRHYDGTDTFAEGDKGLNT